MNGNNKMDLQIHSEHIQNMGLSKCHKLPSSTKLYVPTSSICNMVFIAQTSDKDSMQIHRSRGRKEVRHRITGPKGIELWWVGLDD